MSKCRAVLAMLAGIRGWLAKRFRCFGSIASYWTDFSGKATDCLFIPDELSAKTTWSRETREVLVFAFACFVIGSSVIMWRWGIGGVGVAVSVAGGLFYVMTICIRLYLTLVALFCGKREAADAQDGAQEPSDVPVYSILVPLYREERAISGLLRALEALEWPVEKLDIRLIVDRDDELTINTLRRMKLPPHFHVIAVKPDPYLRSKPRVLNAALCTAKGEFVTIYDAEDRPEPDQLKKAYALFQKYPDMVCCQARLDYYNEKQNVLTRWFAAEYVAWFRYTIAGVSALQLPVPLGGTSNHFRMSALKDVGAWDTYNVTEDCDLGMRIFRRFGSGAVRMLDSTTYEEAPSDFSNWLRQRSRWIKGFFQTFLVHFRYPLQALRDFGARGFLGFLFFTFGGSVVHLVNIGFWSLFILWLCGRNDITAPFFPPMVRDIHLFTFIVGNGLLILLHVFAALREKRYVTAIASVFIPLYWMLMAVASCRAFYQIAVKPHHWDKTHHVGEGAGDDA